jgi:uncharacterized RDD family membrane protein YckC
MSSPVGGSAGVSSGPAPGVVYAGFGSRFLGYVLDTLLLVIAEAVVTVPLVFLPLIDFYRAHPQVAGKPMPALPTYLSNRFLVLGLLGALVTALYFGGLVAWQGRTIGQRALGMFVVRAEDGGRLPPGRAYLRAVIFWGPGILGVVAGVGPIAGLVALVGLLAAAWDPRRQGWHDKLGRSLVVKRVAGAPGYPGSPPETLT